MNRLNRRGFLSRSWATAAAVATASGTRLSLAAEDRTWRVAVIGHSGRGDYGHGLERMWQRVPRTEVVAVADRGGVEAARRRLPSTRAFADYEVMLREIGPDIVAVAPRHVDQHHAMCMAAIAAGVRGIYVEKPFCRTPQEADEIVAGCDAANVSLAVAHRNRYHPVLPVVQRLIEEGRIGRLLEIRARGKEDHRGGAQDLWVLGCHLFNLANYFAGTPLACSGMLYQDDRPCTRDHVREGDEGIGPIAGNEAHARFEMSGGVPLFFDSIQHHGNRDAGFGLQLIGTEGVFDFRIDREPLAHFREGNPHNPQLPAAAWQPVSSAGIGKPEPIEDLAGFVASHQAAGEDLIASIEQNRAPECDGRAARTTIEMICAVLESHRRGGERVELPLSRREHPLAQP